MSNNMNNSMSGGASGGDVSSSSASGGAPISALATIGAGNIISAADASGTPLSVPLPFQNRIVLIEDTRVAGTTHIDNIDAIAENLEIGTQLRFEREPDNLADAWAIRVFAKGVRIGYVPADCNEILARLMDGGKPLSGTLTSKEKIGHWSKLHMEVSLDD